jgi:vitamin B12 transporter
MTYSNKSSALAIAAACIAAPVSAYAADDSIVVTASRVTQDAREIGSSVSVITAEDIQENQIIFVKDALQDLPGVKITTDRPGDYTGVSIRGSNNDEVLWLIDGIELGDPSSTSTEFRADHLTSRDIARIEVLRGNQSSLYGSDAIGGVVNIITKRATSEGLEVNADAEAGSHGALSGSTSIIGKKGAVDFRLTATGYRHNGPSLADPRTAPAGAVTEKDEYWRYGFSGRVGVEANQNLSFQAIGLWQDSFSDLDDTTADNFNTVKKKEHAYAGQANYRSDDQRFQADLTASRYVTQRLYFGAYNLPEGDLYKGYKDELSLALKYQASDAITLAAGGNWEWEKTDQITNYSGDFNEGIDTKSVYGEVALRPIENLTITAAARLDDNSRFGTFDTYRGTAAYIVGPLKLRGSYGTGAKAPGLYQLFDPLYGNLDLKVETSSGGDVGFDLDLRQGLSLQMSYFFNNKKNEINWDGSRPPFGGYNQFGRTRAQGVELGLAAQPFDWLRLNQSFSIIEHEVDNSLNGDGAYIDSKRPEYYGTTAATITPTDRTSLTARARYADGNGSGYGGATKAYTVVDLLGSVAVTDKIEVYARIVNLFDTWYQVSYGTQTLGRSAYGGVRLSF